MRITKNLEKMLLKVLISISGLFFLQTLYAQEKKDFYLVTDFVKMSNPVLIKAHNKIGLYIVEKNIFDNNSNIESLLKDSKAFLYDDNGILLINSTDREEKKISIGECELINKTKIKNKYTIWEYQQKDKVFYLGFITSKKYNSVVVNEHDKGKVLKSTDRYYPILFPICKEN
jgi:hypothetical protein